MPAKTEHPVFDQPESQEVTLWRYLDFSKFADLLLSSSIFFSRSDLLGDPFEGSLSLKTIEKLSEWTLYNYISTGALKRIEDDPLLIDKNVKEHKNIIKAQRKFTFVSCWHMNEVESAAMWNQYTFSNDSIAITTSYRQLVNLLPSNVYVGKVRYIDFKKDIIGVRNAMLPFVYKRKSFEHENEVRAIISEIPQAGMKIQNGKMVDIDIFGLINKVYVSPYAANWFYDVVKRLCNKVGLKTAIQKSDINSEPFW